MASRKMSFFSTTYFNEIKYIKPYLVIYKMKTYIGWGGLDTHKTQICPKLDSS